MCEVEYEALRRDSSDMAKISALRAVLCCEVRARVANHARARASLSTTRHASALTFQARSLREVHSACCSARAVALGASVLLVRRMRIHSLGSGWSAQTYIADLVKHAAPFTRETVKERGEERVGLRVELECSSVVAG